VTTGGRGNKNRGGKTKETKRRGSPNDEYVE